MSRIRKALTAAVGAGLAAYGAAQAKGNVGTYDLIYIVGVALAVGVATYFVPNKDNSDQTNVTKP